MILDIGYIGRGDVSPQVNGPGIASQSERNKRKRALLTSQLHHQGKGHDGWSHGLAMDVDMDWVDSMSSSTPYYQME